MESETIAMHAEDAEDAESAYRSYRAPVFNYLRRCGVPLETAEELMQATFVVLLEKPHRYDARRGPLLPFLLGVARGLRLAWFRHAGATAVAPSETPPVERERYVIPDRNEIHWTISLAAIEKRDLDISERSHP